MNKVTTINLNGLAFQLEENGYEALRAYLDAAAAKLAGNPDRDEIISDIERAIADKFRAVLGAHKTVVVTREVESVIAEMGPVDDCSDPAGAPRSEAGAARASDGGSVPPGGGPAASAADAQPVRRLYRLADGAMFAGVCNGLAAYFGIDPTIVRLLFIVLTVFSGGVVGLVYLVMMFVIPSAETAEQRAAASGEPFTTQEFIRRAKAGYYEGMKTFHDKRARREWRRRFKRDMRAWGDWFQWEMQAGARNWQRYWTPHPAFDAGWTLAMPFISLLKAALALACIVAVGSLLASGTILGHALPVALPVWGGVLLLLFAYTVIVLPLKVARHAYYHGGGWCALRPFQHLWDALVWVGFCVAVLWLVMHHGAAVRHAIHNIPPTVHEAVESIRQWWAQR